MPGKNRLHLEAFRNIHQLLRGDWRTGGSSWLAIGSDEVTLSGWKDQGPEGDGQSHLTEAANLLWFLNLISDPS